jgi:large subunit ribosomal protein L21
MNVYISLNFIDATPHDVIKVMVSESGLVYVLWREFMFVVVRTGGKQYCVKPGDVIKVEKLDAEPAAKLSLTDVLLSLSDKGELFSKESETQTTSVNVEVVRHVRNKKIIVFKKKRRHNYRRKIGHRQWMTVLKVVDISLGK